MLLRRKVISHRFDVPDGEREKLAIRSVENPGENALRVPRALLSTPRSKDLDRRQTMRNARNPAPTGDRGQNLIPEAGNCSHATVKTRSPEKFTGSVGISESCCSFSGFGVVDGQLRDHRAQRTSPIRENR
jgi:hypothetical protein